MIKFQRITTTDAALYKYMEQLMTASFPSSGISTSRIMGFFSWWHKWFKTFLPWPPLR